MTHVNGMPLSDLGLERNVVILADGTRTKLEGFVCLPGSTIEESIRAALPEGATIYADPEGVPK